MTTPPSPSPAPTLAAMRDTRCDTLADRVRYLLDCLVNHENLHNDEREIAVTDNCGEMQEIVWAWDPRSPDLKRDSLTLTDLYALLDSHDALAARLAAEARLLASALADSERLARDEGERGPVTPMMVLEAMRDSERDYREHENHYTLMADSLNRQLAAARLASGGES